MHTNIKRLIAGVTVIAVASVGLISTAASALPAGTAAAGAATISPTSGNSASTLTILPPSGAVCPGDTAVGGYKWQTFIVPNAVDAATLTYGATGPVVVAPNTFASPLYSTAAAPQINKNTAITTGLITGISTYDFAAFAAGSVAAGAYKIGYACTLAGATASFWQTTINVTTDVATGGPAQFSFSPFVVPGAPTLASPLTSGNGTLAGTYTAPAATPAATSFTVTATSAGKPTVTAVGSAGAFTLTGLVNKSAYSVTVTQTNAAGTSVASNAVVGTPADPNERPAVTGLATVPAPGQVTLTWNAPTTVPVSGQYKVAVDVAGTPIAGSPFTVSALTYTLVAPAGPLYNFVVTPVWAAPLFALGATTAAASQSFTTVTQDITVTRPVGGLVLTQTCANYGALPAEPTSLGFDAVLPALPASGTGIAPTINDGRTVADPAFSQYPYPVDAIQVPNPTYPTHCALNLGIAKLITSGTEAGKYFKADGRISQVAIVDTRDTDAGWVLNGKVSDFASGANTFSGNYLGWTPVKTLDSGVTLEGYDQTVVAGSTVAPAFASGLTTDKVLASAQPNLGLGIAYLDARLKLLIPVTANNGVYSATLTISAL